MTTFATNNPRGSVDPRDLFDNAQNFDTAINTITAALWQDRFGRNRHTWYGFEGMALKTINDIKDAGKQAIRDIGYTSMDSFQAGATLTLPNQILRDTTTGLYYRWDGAFPKSVPAGSTPENSGGIGIGAWQLISTLGFEVPVDSDDTMYLSTYMFMFADQILPVFTRSIFGDRKDYSSKFLNFGVRDNTGTVYSVESDYAIQLDASKIPFPVAGDHYYFTARREYYETDKRQRRQVLFRKVAPTAVLPNNLKYMVIGDSNTNIAFADLLRESLRSRGHNPNFVGTIPGQGLNLLETSGPLGEGRSGWSSADFTYRVTDRSPVAIGSEPAYNAYTKNQKFTKNPFIIASSEPDSFNGYKFDFPSYLSRFGIATPDIVGIGLGPNNLSLPGTPEQIATDFINDIRIIIDSVWQANPNAKIALYLRGVSKTEAQDGLMEGHRQLQAKLIEFTRAHPKHGQNLWLIHAWAHMTQEAGYSITQDSASYGVVKGSITDGVHSRIYEATRGQYVAAVAPWMAWVAYADNAAGYNSEPPHERVGPGGQGMTLGLSPSVMAVPANQQSGVSAGQSTKALMRATSSTSGPNYVVGKSRGAESNPTSVLDADTLGKYSSAGYVDDRFMSGAELEFFVDGTPVAGQYTPSGARISVVKNADKSRVTSIRFRSDLSVEAGLDNIQSLGVASKRWGTIFAGTGAINTSDGRDKTEPLAISSLSDQMSIVHSDTMTMEVTQDEDRILDAWGDVSIIAFRWLASLEQKGEGARWHFGVIAQQVRDAFAAHGMDGTRFGLLCYDEWGDEYEKVLGIRDNLDTGEQEEFDTGEVRLVKAAGNRWGIRPDQCLFLEAAYQRRNQERLLKRIEALEHKE